MFAFLPTTDPYTNLATEELLLQQIEQIGPTLLLYVNTKCVVMGKHQNPLLECRPEFLGAQGVPLLRRFTGGGTVFHDEGNLNFSFLMPKNGYNEALHFQILQRSLLDFGIQSEIDTHKSLWYGNRKFSGSALARKLIGNIHHGTLLVESNLELLNQCIQPTFNNLETKAPRSRRAPVMNLKEVNSQISISKIAAAIGLHFTQMFPTESPLQTQQGNQQNRINIVDSAMGETGNEIARSLMSEKMQPFIEKHQSREWVFGATPEY